MTDAPPPSPYDPPAPGSAPPPPPPGYAQAPPPGYGQAPPAYAQAGYPTAVPRNGMGTAALVLGIIGLVLCWTSVGGIILGGLALVFGIVGRRRASRQQATNGGVALAGAILGGLALVAGVLFGAFYLAHKDDIKNYSDCLRHAHTRAEQQQCADDFNRSVGG